MLLRQVKRCIERERLAEPEQSIYVAVSGGADSVALLTALYMLGYRLEVLHCNFNLRGVESDADEAFVVDYARRLDLPCSVRSFDTRAYAAEHKCSIEMAARELRYAWFYELLKAEPTCRIALGHHADDVVETFLYNLVQGTGIRGLAGMPYERSGGIIRPLLDCTRAEVLHFLQTNPYINTYCEDSTNSDTIYRRNYIRHELIPALDKLKANANRQIHKTITQLRGVEAFYRAGIELYKQRVVRAEGISIEGVLNSPDAVSLLFELLSPYGFSSPQCYEIAEALPMMSSGTEYLSADYRLVRSWDYLQLLPRHRQELETLTLTESDLHRVVSYGGLELYLQRCQGNIQWRDDVLYLPMTSLQGGQLQLRRMQEGDRMRPFGMKQGSKRLSRILIDGKAAHRERKEAFVLTLGGEILWLLGHCKSELTRLSTKDLEGELIGIQILTVPKAPQGLGC